jgi:hypothetical protein
MAQRTPPAPAKPSPAAVSWRYVIFWIVFLGLLFFIALYSIIAEA